jgi:two-component system, cell cycle sensor histidine kinase and response regulator CckA
MTATRILLEPLLGNELPFITLFPAVFLAAWAGGLGPALLATAASVLLALLLFFPPTFSHGPIGIIGAGLFLLIGVATGWLGQSRLRAQARAEAAAREASEAAAIAEEAAARAEEEAEEAMSAVESQAEAEAALRRSEERYRAFIEQTAEGVWRIELEQPVSVQLPENEQIDSFYRLAYLAECNDAMAQMYGFERAAELFGARLDDLTPRSDPNNLDFLRAFIRSGYRLTDAQSHERDRDGNERYFLNNFIGIVERGNLVRAWGSQRDVTLSRQAETAIQASEARFRSVFESGMLGIAFWNGEWMTGANDVLLAMLGYSRKDLESGLLRLDRLTPPGFEEVDRRANEQIRVSGSCAPYEKELLRKDGSRVPVLVGGARLGPDLRDAAFFALDLTERRHAEDRLRQAERIEVVGQLAGGMAHEANNQMSVVLGATSFILARSDLPETVRQDVEYIQQAAERTASITRQLLAFSRRQILQPKVLDLNSTLRNLDPILRRTITEQQRLVFHLASELRPIRADPAQLDQVLLNLTINARDAMPEGGTLTLETRAVHLTHELAQRADMTVAPGRYTALLVSDTGHGMDKETIRHLFEPFFTTKDVGKGSGLGLAMVYGIMRQSGGYIWADSEPGVGTTFKLYFPSLAEAVTAHAPRPEEAPGASDGGRILLVEDDPLVRSMARRSLVEAGFEVLEAANGQEALALIASEMRPLDAVLTDLAMPEVGGRLLAQHLREAHPDLPVVFMSGYTDDDVARRGLLEAGVPFLEKPLSPGALVRQMRQVLDASRKSVGSPPN